MQLTGTNTGFNLPTAADKHQLSM